MIKTSGYRVSPTEIEELLYETQLVGEAAAFGVPHPALGQAIVVVATQLAETTVDEAMLLAECKSRLPAYMVPGRIDLRTGPLPRNPNGKIDRKTLAAEYQNLFDQS
jgi:acyl-CoA synthetase (AMP-forming)/AMP-acid ligase II